MKMRPWIVPVVMLAASVHAAEKEVFDVMQVDSRPKAIRKVSPDYPVELRRERIEGMAITRYVVDTDGRVRDAECVGTNHPWFGEASVDALRKSRFSPGRIHGRAVRTRCIRNDSFTLMDDGGPRLHLGIPDENTGVHELPTELAFNPYKGGAQLSVSSNSEGFSINSEEGSLPEYVGNTAAVYPFEALQEERPGHVVIQFTVGTDARAHSLKILDASAPEFALAAEARLLCSWFTPGSRRDERNYGPFTAEFDFRPGNGGDARLSGSARSLLKVLKNDPDEILTSGFDVAPRPLRTVPPIPPPTILRAGRAVIEVLIDEDGHPQLPRIVSCSEPEFGAAAAQAAVKWLFVPAQREGRTVVIRVQIPFEFEIVKQEEAAKS